MNHRTQNDLKTEVSRKSETGLEKSWARPVEDKAASKGKKLRIRLEVKREEKIERKGRLVNQFLLREEAEEERDSFDSVKAKRKQFKALFEASVRR